jgi:protein-disulfide isomerase
MVYLSAGDAAAAPDQASTDLTRALIELTKEIKGLRQDINGLIEELQVPAPAAAGTTRSARKVPSLSGKEIPLGDNPALGSAAAKIAIVEFSDYQCPFCRKFFLDTFFQIKRDFIDTGKVRFVYFDFPLTFHPHAEGAAVAARCAGQQNHYWDMHDRLFSNQFRLGEQFYRDQAAALGLDAAAFSKCLDDPAHDAKIRASIALGEKLGVAGTPAFFIGNLAGGTVKNLRLVSGAKSYKYFADTIAAVSR